MFGYLVLAAVGLLVAHLISTYRAFARNLAAAKQSGLPYICTPIYIFNKFWLVTQKLWLPFIRHVARIWPGRWIDLLEINFEWHLRHQIFKELGCDVFIMVAPGANILYVADAEAMTQITTRRTDFPKPTYMYTSVDLFGKSVVSTEGAVWRQHRKVMSPPFSEKNNILVWKESLHQAQCMMTGWMGKSKTDSGPIWTVPTDCMRLSLHIISRAGFGVRLHWPHENQTVLIPQGHGLSYKDALEKLLQNLIPVMLMPRWLLNTLPFQATKQGSLALKEWGQYMREMYHEKRDEVKRGESGEGMDLMGALVRGSGLTEENLNGSATDPEKASQSKRLLSDEEILGNCFTLILAGHETTANSIHFSLLYLAMHISSQRRLQADLDSIFGSKPVEEWDYEVDMPKLFGGMAGAVMNEELRLVAPVVGIPKTTAKDQPQDLVIDGKHVTVPANCHITLNTVATHRNPKYWPHTDERDLLEFRPERWLLDPSKATATANVEEEAYAAEEGLPTDNRPDTAASLFRPPKGSFIPFSEGYRSCLGRRFAQIEILAVLAYIFKYYSVELDVSEYLSDDEFAKATEGQRKEAWGKADENARYLLQHCMFTIITLQMREGRLPVRFVRRGGERFGV